jgi:hypothetical protein
MKSEGGSRADGIPASCCSSAFKVERHRKERPVLPSPGFGLGVGNRAHASRFSTRPRRASITTVAADGHTPTWLACLLLSLRVSLRLSTRIRWNMTDSSSSGNSLCSGLHVSKNEQTKKVFCHIFVPKLTLGPPVFQTEVYLLGGVLFFAALVLIGISRNSSRANKWCALYWSCHFQTHICVRFKAHVGVLEKQFSKPVASGDGLISDGYSDFFSYSTGRKHVNALHTIFKLRPRHDPTQIIYQFLYGLYDLNYAPQDEVQLDFTLAPGYLPHDFVWAVAKKEELKSIKDDRWDLVSWPSGFE